MKYDGNLHGPRLKTLVLNNISQNSFRTWKDLDRETIFVYSLIVFEFGKIVKIRSEEFMNNLNIVQFREQDLNFLIILQVK